MEPGGDTQRGAHVATPANPLLIASVASAGAAVLHAAAGGAHAETAELARLFMLLAVAQGAAAVAGFVRPGRLAAAALVAVNTAAAGGWLLTRFTGLSDVPGLEVAEAPGLADTSAAVLALVAALGALFTLLDVVPADARRGVASASVVAVALVVPGLLDVTDHNHADAAAGHSHAAAAPDPATAVASGSPTPAAPASATPVEPDVHEHPDVEHADQAHGHDTAAPDTDAAVDAAVGPVATPAPAPEPAAWPWPWHPEEPIDFTGVPGVTAEQQARAEQLVADTLRDLPAFADVTSVGALGYRSIGDASTGFEHYINLALLGDDKTLDPTAPESLVYQVDGARRTLVSAMFIARATGVDDPELTGFAGPLMQWHNHTNLCWGPNGAGEFVVQGVTDPNTGTCPEGQMNTGGEFPMVHVWIAPHECGPFAALEGHGAGQAGALSADERVDLCSDHHAGDHPAGDHGTGTAPAAADGSDGAAPSAVPYDPALPIDLGGVAGVTPEQQAFAENLVADTLRNLPQWADPAVAEAAGFHSIQDGGTGHEHYIQWDWIDDDVWLDPDHPESLVYEPQADGSKLLVSAMYMLPTDVALTDVPDWGGALMQWHIHGDLCFTDDPVAPRVAGTKPIGGTCQAPLVDRGEAPMIHVWITPHRCGPFAALEGIGAGQVGPGQEHFCDTAHGTH